MVELVERPAVRERVARPELDEVLRAVNAIRTARGGDPIYELPKGVPVHAFGCVLFIALSDVGLRAAAGTTGLRWPEGHHPYPPVLERFRLDFDNGKYPELEA